MDGNIAPLITKGKPTIVQLFGSWCPNCIDETKFIKNWRAQNPDSDLQFIMVAFERSPTQAHAVTQLKKAQKLYQIDYPIFIGGHNSDFKVPEIIKGLKNFISFPTTLYVDKKGKVRKVHAGFAGPATGQYYEQFSTEFQQMVLKLISE